MSLHRQVALRTLVAVVLVPLALLACGGGGGGPADPGGNGGNNNGGNNGGNNNGGSVSSATVTMTSGDDSYGSQSHAFTPETVFLLRNGTVTWSNSTGVSHNVTFTSAGAPSNVANHTSGTSSRTFPTSGTYNYQCGNHSGMTGTVVVQ